MYVFHVYPLQIFDVLLTMIVVPFCFKLILLAVACIRYLIITYLECCGMNFSYWLLYVFSGWSSTTWMVGHLGISCLARVAGFLTVHLCSNYAVITGQSLPRCY